jgi:PAS domain-containing protein
VKAAVALREEKERLATTLASIGDAVIATDTAERVTIRNDVAQALTGWTQAWAVHQPPDDAFHIVDAATQSRIDNPSAHASREARSSICLNIRSS